MNPLLTYTLPPEELARYRALPRPEKARVLTEWHGNGKRARPVLMVVERRQMRR